MEAMEVDDHTAMVEAIRTMMIVAATTIVIAVGVMAHTKETTNLVTLTAMDVIMLLRLLVITTTMIGEATKQGQTIMMRGNTQCGKRRELFV